MILTTTMPGTRQSPLGCLSSSPVVASTHSQNSKVMSSNAAILDQGLFHASDHRARACLCVVTSILKHVPYTEMPSSCERVSEVDCVIRHVRRSSDRKCWP